MAISVHAPRVNNNDDEVRLVGLEVAVGDRVARGQVVAQVETDKAVVEVEAPAEGFVLGIAAEIEAQVAVGSVLLWLGASADEPLPQAGAPADAESATTELSVGAATAKARLLLRRYGLEAEAVPMAGARLTAEDVERHIAALGLAESKAPAAAFSAPEPQPTVAGEWRSLASDEKGMLLTVTWHRDHAVPGYLELEYDPEPWIRYAKSFAERHRLMLSPLLSLMAWRLAGLAVERPKLNSTIVGERGYHYATVNLGFTVQVGETLYLCVQRDAARLNALGLVNALGELQRRAAVHKLGADETQGATISFSSMERWKVGRHIPVLPPHTALMVAHAMDVQGRAVLGATYDHRVLNGFQVAATLRKLAIPPADAS
jgi:pyruvate/2-oxoglutarate dehydrogenase complex dihydrolipoamide acyltransferase (E2) component